MRSKISHRHLPNLRLCLPKFAAPAVLVLQRFYVTGQLQSTIHGISLRILPPGSPACRPLRGALLCRTYSPAPLRWYWLFSLYARLHPAVLPPAAGLPRAYSGGVLSLLPIYSSLVLPYHKTALYHCLDAYSCQLAAAGVVLCWRSSRPAASHRQKPRGLWPKRLQALGLQSQNHL